MTHEDSLLQNTLPEQTSWMEALIREGRPYVWELRLGLSEFLLLEEAMMKSVTSHGGDHQHLLCHDFAVKVVIYIAERYKRRYGGDGAKQAIQFSSTELKRLYELAGIDADTFVYNASRNPDRPSRRWLESMQILGGLPLQAEIKRADSDGLMTKLCRIFHGEETNLDTLADRNRAVAFSQSIKRCHSLYDYFDCIFDKDKQLPFAPSDLEDRSTFVPQFLKLMAEANRQALREKFDFDWVVSYIASRNLMVRHLRIGLKPEVMGGGRRQYIGYDRLRTEEWGMEHPEDVGRIMFHLLFKDGRRIVSRSQEPLFKYDNTGDEKTGFLSIGQMDEAIYTDVPAEAFDRVEILMTYNGKEHVVQTLPVRDYMQLYAVPGTGNKFTTRRNSQVATVLVFSDRYHLTEDYAALPVVFARYANARQESEAYCWCPINDKVVIADEQGNELPPFFNRNGLYQVVTKKYMDTIKYRDNVFVLYQYLDADYDEEEMQEDLLPVMFGRNGLEVVHYENTKDNAGLAVSDYQLKWLKDNAYVDWAEEEPQQGATRLKVYVNDYEFRMQVYYVPWTSNEKPVWRDFGLCRICTSLTGVNDIQDEFDTSGLTHEPDTRPLMIGNDNAHIVLDIYRPVLLHELYQNGRLVETVETDRILEIPLINCRQFAVRDFSEKGVHQYRVNCRNNFFYSFTTLDSTGLDKSNYQASRPIALLDAEVPLDFLKIYISKYMDAASGRYAWNYRDKPYKMESKEIPEDAEIVFQSLKDETSPRHYALPWFKSIDSNDWGDDWGDSDWENEGKEDKKEMRPADCFLEAARHRTYFFLFEPLVKTVAARRQAEDIVVPLLKENDYALTDNITEDLYKFALHFHFDWMLLPRDNWREAISHAATDESERERLTKGVMDFFRRTPKITDEREHSCLDEFLEKYWTFDLWPRVDGIADKALKLILDRPDALAGVVSLRDLLKLYDGCRFKFIEMSKVVISHNNDI